MGTTESLLYDDAPMEPTSTPSTPPRAMMVEPSSVSSPNKAMPHRPTRTGDAKLKTTQQHRLQQLQQQIPRRRPPPQAKPIKRMGGLVLGGPKTGKRTLLSRLKGVDPFAVKNNADSTEAKKESNPSIIIQYKPPSESPTWDRIKLRIQYAAGIDDTKITQITRIDFVVVLISPKDSRETTQSYLEGILGMYLDRIGYRKAAGADDDNDNDNEKRKANTGNHDINVTEPFCIAILFNFRDLEDAQKEEKDRSASRADLERLVDDTLRCRNVLENKVVVELLETSLYNCYGLDGLHRFIYRTYLQRSQRDIERQLNVVQNQIQLTNNNNDRHNANEKNATSKSMTYDEFLKEIAPKETPQHQRKELIDPVTKDYRQEESAPRRMNLRQPQKQNLRMGKDALEAFLASSSDEEDTETTISGGMRFSNTVVDSSSSDSDEDSDDDFFYDESGNRRHHTNNRNPKNLAGRGGEVEEVPSASNAPFKNPKQTHQQSKKLETSLQTTMDEENSSSEEGEEDEPIEYVRKEIASHEDNVSETSTINEGEDLGKKEHTSESYTAINEREKEGGVDANGRARQTDDEIDADAMTDVANKSDSEIDNFNNNSPQESNDNANDEVDTDNEDNENIASSTPAVLGPAEDSNDVYVIGSTPVVKNVVQDDNEDSDEDYMIGSTPDVNNVVQDDNEDSDEDYMIGSTPDVNNVVQDDDDDSDDDYMIGSAPDVNNVVQDYNEESDDDYMIGSNPAQGKVAEDNDEDDDGFMIGSIPVIQKVEQDDNNDDHIHETGSTPDIGKAMENDADADEDDELIIGNLAKNDQTIEDDDDSGFVIQSNSIDDDKKEDTDQLPNTRLPNSHSIERSFSGIAVEADGMKEDFPIRDENPTSQELAQSLSATEEVPNSPQPSEIASSGGISHAALAAIAAAQQEAEAMMRQQRQQQQYSQIPSTMIKEKKTKKKKKDEKKKKKKKKAKGLED